MLRNVKRCGLGWAGRVGVDRGDSVPGPSSATIAPTGPAVRPLRLAAPLLLLPLLSACSPAPPGSSENLRGHLHVLVSSPSVEGLSKGLEEENERSVRLLVQEYRKLQPRLSVSVAVVREEELEGLLRRRQAMGLAPDLLLTSTSMARRLAAAGLSSRQTLPSQLLGQLRPDALASLRRSDGSLDGVPMALLPDLACYSRRSTPSPPSTIGELEQLEQRGLESGMAVEGRHMYWTAGSLGAQTAISELLAGATASASRRAAIRRWLDWLLRANRYKGVIFLNSLQQLAQELVQGRLDWVMCNSASLPRLREGLGDDLGVMPLPAGPGGEASQIRRQKVWVQSRRIPERRRRLAEALVRFSVQPPFQASFGLEGSSAVPVNRVVAPQRNHQDPQVRALAEASRPDPAADRFQEQISHTLTLVPQMNRVLRQLIDAELELEQGLDLLLAILEREGRR